MNNLGAAALKKNLTLMHAYYIKVQMQKAQSAIWNFLLKLVQWIDFKGNEYVLFAIKVQ